MPGLDALLGKQVSAFLVSKYTITLCLLTFGSFLVRWVTFHREQVALQSDPSLAAADAPAGALRRKTSRRFASYLTLTWLGVLCQLGYAGTFLVATIYEDLTPPPTNLRHFQLPPGFWIPILGWGLTCLLGIGCALYALARSIQLRRWDWMFGIIALFLSILVVTGDGGDLFGGTIFPLMIVGPASAIIFGLFGPTNRGDWSR
jgi:hypothetical protein